MQLLRLAVTITLVMASALAHAQERISYTYKSLNGTSENLDAVVTTTAAAGKKPAVVILHNSAGWEQGMTKQYADMLSENGFVAIEPILFRRPTKTTYGESLAKTLGAVLYLSTRSDVDANNISVIGTSYGANLSVFSATQWAQSKYLPEQVKIRKIAALYPVCWFYPKLIKRDTNSWFFKERLKDFPEDFMDTWANIPMKLFAAGQDDYSSKDATVCPTFKDTLPSEAQKALTSVVVYPDATHGWDQGRTFSFNEPAACKGQGCTNTNAFNPAITAQAKKELLEFLTKD